ncbi:hypothetical protein FACS1894103_4530 [Campylobacterota bacterium]|nr:hypothetical protein FACS1894103_4530 [Campylobacterota bacterium]
MKRLVIYLACLGALYAEGTPDPQDVVVIDTRVEEIRDAKYPSVPAFKNPFFYPPREVNGTMVYEPRITEPILESVIGSRALISGQWKRVGEVAVSGWKVQKVLIDSVVIRKDKTERTLTLTSGATNKNYITKVGG